METADTRYLQAYMKDLHHKSITGIQLWKQKYSGNHAEYNGEFIIREYD